MPASAHCLGPCRESKMSPGQLTSLLSELSTNSLLFSLQLSVSLSAPHMLFHLNYFPHLNLSQFSQEPPPWGKFLKPLHFGFES